MNRSIGGLAALLATSSMAFATTAASQSREDRHDADRIWSVALGAGAIYRPDYQGSDDYEVRALPMFAISYRDFIHLRGLGLSVDLFELTGSELADTLSFGPLVRFDGGREADDNPILRHFGDIDEGALAGLFVSYELGPVQFELTATQDVTNRYDGVIAEFEAGYGVMLSQRLRAGIQISTTWSNDDYMQAYFGVTEQQAGLSGLREFAAGSGMKDVGAALSLNYLLTEHWRVTGQLSYRRLLGDAADSPLVEDEGSRNQASGALFVSYRF